MTGPSTRRFLAGKATAADLRVSCYIDAMISRGLGVAAVLLSLALEPAVVAAQTNKQTAPAHSAASPAAAPAQVPPAAPASISSATSSGNAPSQANPAASPGAAPSEANPAAAPESCQGGSCGAPTPHITIATPAPAPAPWPLQERISWAANLILVLIAYVGIMLALSTLRKIERQTRYGETAAQAAAESAKTALLLAQAQERAERPWIVITPEPVPGLRDSFTVVATNRGRSPARIVSLADEVTIARDESHLPLAPAYKNEPHAPRALTILLPGESTGVKSFQRDDVKSVCETAEDLRRVEEWEAKIYLYGTITYADLRSPAEEPARETAWCCWYIHGRQKSGMVMAGPPEYNRHT